MYFGKENTKLEEFYKSVIEEKLKDIKYYEECKNDKDYTAKEIKNNIKEVDKEIKEIKKLYKKITEENYKPKINIKLYFSYGCYLIDCIRHNTF